MRRRRFITTLATAAAAAILAPVPVSARHRRGHKTTAYPPYSQGY